MASFGFRSLCCCLCGSKRKFQKLQTSEPVEEVESLPLKKVQTEQPKFVRSTTPILEKEGSCVSISEKEESTVLAVEEEESTAPIAAEEESLLLGFEGESISQTESKTNTPLLPREPILEPTTDSVLGSSEQPISFTERELKLDNTKVVTKKPKSIPDLFTCVESSNTQLEPTFVKETFKPSGDPSKVSKEEEKETVSLPKQEVKEQEVKTGKGEVTERKDSPSTEKDKLLEAINLTLTNIMEKADKLVVEQVSVNMATKSEHAAPNSEVLSSLVEQIQAPAEREATPDSDGSMHGSSGSEALEEALKDAGIVNGDKHEEKGGDKQEKGDKKEEKTGKSKKKEDKTIDHILRALSSLQTTEEKLAALCKKYADLHEEHRVLQSTHKQHQRKLAMVTREKDQLQTEHTKAVMAKSKLEGLCRELQKHNQVIRQESLQRAREEDEKRKEISNKFQSTISEIQQQMTDHHDRNLKLREENQELAGKLKKFIEQYEVREKQVEKVMQHRELEQKLADAKLEQANAYLAEEQEKCRKEHLVAAENAKRAALLETQLAMYKERYEEFQSTINRSNDMFQKFKTEMEKMTKRIKKLEKDGAAWKNKWENANKALLEMAEEKQLYDKEKPLLLNKIQKLESLCRAMQAERLGRKAAEAHNIDISNIDEELPKVLASSTTPPKSSPAKLKPQAENASPLASGSDEKSPPTEPSREEETEDDAISASTDKDEPIQKSEETPPEPIEKTEETPAESNPEPQPEAKTAET
ncbi:alpha-taxilin-like isoform X1 [Saccostrea echinata]|uniref:alpha-taxilin-like isoform X1 n=1 Tax=Saccostrea echinata TaxID=191078 RepID=UPI002A7FC069|nr:alpha-taxilin-like isoform X1 [Saccostrea echinata]